MQFMSLLFIFLFSVALKSGLFENCVWFWICLFLISMFGLEK